MENNVGVKSIGVKCPIIREGDNLVDIVFNSIKESGIVLQDKDVIGITESIVARACGNYATIQDIAESVRDLFKDHSRFDRIILLNPIYSRNRFAMILKGIARVAEEVYIVMGDIDEVGNVRDNHPFTGMNYGEYYAQICHDAGAVAHIVTDGMPSLHISDTDYVIDCSLHHRIDPTRNKYKARIKFLYDILSDKCEYGVLGSNKATETKIKLFPNHEQCMDLLNGLVSKIKSEMGVSVEAMVYGDGCFKSPIGGIWEFADPVTSPGYTAGLEGFPNEIKIKAFADDKYAHMNGAELDEAIREEIKNAASSNLKGKMASQGTTPRKLTDLLASLMDLTSGSGDKGTPVVVVQNYFKKF